MERVLLFAVLGLGTGALVAGIALAIVLTYRGAESAGGSGEALVCGATYVPIAGHSVGGDEFTESMSEYHIAVALVPAPGSNFLIPSRISLTDGSGTPVAEARAIAISGR